MPKNSINYSNTTFYKISCKDAANHDIYIGYTTNFIQRKYSHKQWCKNETCPKNERRLCDAVHKWGGWDNWTTEILSSCSCRNIQEVIEKTNVYIQQYGATLNRVMDDESITEQGNIAGSHLKNTSYICDVCLFVCSKKVDWMRHLQTRKHQTNIGLGTNEQQCVLHTCSGCNKKYNSRTSLWRHARNCVGEANTIRPDTKTILEILRQNQTFRELMVEQSAQLRESHRKMEETQQHMLQTQNENMELHRQLLTAVNGGKLQSGYIQNHHTTNHHHHNNQKFNLNFFLNTTCKDAINMSEFIETIEVQMSELENIGHNGYVAGMTDIILSRIKDLDVSKRPVHCTDLKRETMYIKDQNEWNKDTAEKSYLRKAIAMVSKKNYGKTMEWREHNPECLDIGSAKYDFCFKMMRNVLGDFEDVQVKLDNKIIKNLAKEVVVDR